MHRGILTFCIALVMCCSLSAETYAAPNSGALSVSAFQYGRDYELICDNCGKKAGPGAKEGDSCKHCSKTGPGGFIALGIAAVVGLGRFFARSSD